MLHLDIYVREKLAALPPEQRQLRAMSRPVAQMIVGEIGRRVREVGERLESIGA